MILFLDETIYKKHKVNFNILVEIDFLEKLFIDNIDFIGTKFIQNKEFDYEILKSTSEIHDSYLKLKDINFNNNIYRIEWLNPNKQFADFHTYCYIENINEFMDKKKMVEMELEVEFGQITNIEKQELGDNYFLDYKEAALKIIQNQKNITSENFIYYLFEDILNIEEIETLKKINFVQ